MAHACAGKRRFSQRTGTGEPRKPPDDACHRSGSGAGGACQRRAAALATASAVMFTTRRTVAEVVRMWAEAAVPSRMGPTVTPWPPVILSTLKRMLDESRLRQIRLLASQHLCLS